LLGFRNRAVPNVADIVVIGDSQTYGNNAWLEENWPSHMRNALGRKLPLVYNMSVGGWGAVQYLNMLKYATQLRPKVVVVAFYSGNDALESFALAYASREWAFLRVDAALRAADAPKVVFPPPENEWWKVEFNDGTRTVFTPRLRYSANDPSDPAVRAGYGILREAARLMAEHAQRANIKLVMTVIPTKELAYRKKVAGSASAPAQDYAQLVQAEAQNIAAFAAAIATLPGAIYVDVVGPLQEAALGSQPIYPDDADGHPIATGYRVIGKAIAQAVDPVLRDRPVGLVAYSVEHDKYSLSLINHEGVWRVSDLSLLTANGWGENLKIERVDYQDIATLPSMGTLSQVDRRRFGPRSPR
jgi:lysophospholipase L1-like esterase